jgi:trimeric autotransporter adhesin
MSKTALTQAEIAALAASAGITPPAAAATGTEVTKEEKETQEAADAAAAAAAATAAAEASAAASATKPAATPSALEVLGSQLAASAQTLAQTQLELTQANARADALQKTVDGLSAVVSMSVSTMQVALGASAPDLSKLSGDQLLAEHATTAEKFKSTFKVGGVAAVSKGGDVQDKPVVDANHLARVNATRFNTK